MSSNLKDTHPQKYHLKLVSKMMYYCGFGSYWYEGDEDLHPRFYTAWRVFTQSYVFVVILDEILAIIRPDLNTGEKSNVVQIGVTQFLAVLKYIIVNLQRQRIRDGLKRLLEDDRDIFTSVEVERQSVRAAKYFFVPFICACYSYLIFTVAHWILVSLINGTPIKTQVTYFPTPAHVGFPYGLLRILIIAHFWIQVTMTVTSECLCALPIFFVAAKFKQVQMYFENMGENHQQNWSREDFEKAVINGIKLHQNALWCARNIQSAMGSLYGVQIIQTVILAGVTLCQVASAERTFSNLFEGAVMIVCVSLLTGIYMINSGIITYEAGKVGTSIFHCGWERVRMDKGVRTLLVVAIQQAQQPVYMTAFGMVNLSHENFVLVLRAAYSFFALVY